MWWTHKTWVPQTVFVSQTKTVRESEVARTRFRSTVALIDYKRHQKKGKVRRLLGAHCVWHMLSVLTRDWQTWSHSVLQSPLEVGTISISQERKRSWGRWMAGIAWRGWGWYMSGRTKLKLLFVPNVFESMNKWVLEHNKRQNKSYTESMGSVSIPTTGNWELMFCVSLKRQSRYIPVFVDLEKKRHHLFLLHSCFVEGCLCALNPHQNPSSNRGKWGP